MFKIRYSWGRVGNDQLRVNGNQERFPYLYTVEEIWRRNSDGSFALDGSGNRIPDGGTNGLTMGSIDTIKE